MDKKSYSDRIDELLSEMPEFVSDFIYNFGKVESYNTKLEYCRDIRMFLDFIVNFIPDYAETDIKDLTLDDISGIDVLYVNRYLTRLGENHEETTVKRRRASIASMYSFFMKSGKIKANPIAVSKKISLPERNVIYLTNDEQRKLLESVRSGSGLTNAQSNYHNQYADRDSAIFLLLLDTGLRVSEMLTSDIGDYDLTAGSVVVTRKGGDTQTVYYSDECIEYLQTYFDAQKAKFNLKDINHFPAFTALSGERLGVRAVERLVKKYVKAALPEKAEGSKITPHKLRSSFAMSFYAASGNDILKLQKKLNHKSIATTNVYAKAANTDMEDTRNLLQGLR